jgi:hypothetical protein
VIYEHAPGSTVAHRLANDLRGMLEEMRKQGAKVYDHETAGVFRAIERGARDMKTQANGASNAYLSLMSRLLQVNRIGRSADGQAPDDRPAPSIVLP